MAKVTENPSLASSHPSSGGISDLNFDFFDIPGSRRVQGNAFPLGLKVHDNAHVSGIDEAVKYIEELAERGVFRELLQKRKHELAQLLTIAIDSEIDGVILFRGLPISTPDDFSKFTKAFKLPQPHQEVGLSGKRTTVGDNVKTANEEPSHVKFYYHNEYGRSAHFPGILFFFSQVVPEQGGQSPLLSTVELYERLLRETPRFVQTLTEKGLGCPRGSIELY